MKSPAVITISILIILFSLTSCRGDSSVFKNLPVINRSAAQNQNQQRANNNGSGTLEKAGSGEESPTDFSGNLDTGAGNASLFDYTAIEIDTTKSPDIEIINCDVYLDIDGDLLILGEIKNSSLLYKTNVEITFDFYNSKGEMLDSQKARTIANYILPGKRFPFGFVYDKKAKYIDISMVKIGANYKNYNKSFEGFPVVTRKNYYYIDDMMVINGNISNIGGSDIEDLKLIGVFYNYKNRVVFLKECYLAKDKLFARQTEDFVLKILLDEYTPQFTHFKFEAAFRDALKV